MTELFDVIETGGRRPRRWIGLAVVLVLVGVPVVGLLSSRDPMAEPASEPTPGSSRTSADSAPSPSGGLNRVLNAPNALHARAADDGDMEVLDVVFPDGQRAEVRYPAKLNLDRLGSRPFHSVWVDGRYRQLVAPYNGEAEVTKGGKPIREFAPNVTLWPRQSGSASYGQVLLFAFGPWRVAMYDRWQGLDFTDRVALAQRLRGKVTGDGYLTLSVKDAGGVESATDTGPGAGPVEIRMARPGEIAMGDPVGPQLWFGGGTDGMVMLIPTPDCKEPRTPPRPGRWQGRAVRDVCRGGMRIGATGDERFVTTALDGIRVKLK
ncbi:hypothetical protein LDL08_03810 [Nonomuraea glycinis]|uniref:Uncharacterized protein n=1 Tax=Nonomuraea glycinis TaxID=2047744 RepID=A0A917ZY09_9ACTN|nr:hypothetical protein [Nonomuraea glycinis]MCA2175302.1 hypothetical protein [Nonomuraea glycinis]GGP00293.1 hypothetical protein GCM10012278_00530 [Nonomuraea glycinis]